MCTACTKLDNNSPLQRTIQDFGPRRSGENDRLLRLELKQLCSTVSTKNAWKQRAHVCRYRTLHVLDTKCCLCWACGDAGHQPDFQALAQNLPEPCLDLSIGISDTGVPDRAIASESSFNCSFFACPCPNSLQPSSLPTASTPFSSAKKSHACKRKCSWGKKQASPAPSASVRTN
jgi:hypothetical protein